MRFYYNNGLNLCADEEWVIDDVVTNFVSWDEEYTDLDRELVRAFLRSKREVYGWYECQVSDNIKKKFERED